MTVNHKDMAGASLHEPKGVAGASASTVYVANGSGSGTWQKISTSEIDSTFKNSNLIVLNMEVDDLSTAESHFIVCPIAGDIQTIYSVIDGAIATADTTLTAKIATVAVTNGVITIAYSGSAAADVDSTTPSGANTLTAGQAIEIVCGGETNTSGAHAHLSIVIDVS
jgi:hypothetical protein